jgi:putative protease
LTIDKTEIPYPYKKTDYSQNISNHLAEKFYRRHGVEEIENSFETSTSRITGPLMTTKLCLKHENNLCHKQNNKNKNFAEPYYLNEGNTRYRVEFDCKNCFMLIFKL